MRRIAIIEDDMDQARLLAFWLGSYGFSCTLFVSAEAFLDSSSRCPEFDLLLLDWMLPGQNGVDLLSCLLANPRVPPVIMVTSKSREDDLAFALHAGADDFISKPVSKTVLLARVRAVLRRHGKLVCDGDMPKLVSDQSGLALNYANQRVCLTRAEFQLLGMFLREQAGHPIARDDLGEAVWGETAVPQSGRALDLLISRLRRKLSALNPSPGTISSCYGKGYCFKSHNC